MRTTAIAFAVLLACRCAVAAGGDITQDRAHQLAAYYYAHYWHYTSGGAGLPTLQGDYWQSAVHIGRGGTTRGFILVHRLTGKVSYSHPFSLKPRVSAESLDRWSKSQENGSRKP
jgi:hypothetical protein